jgi:hypothetical protein
VVDATWRFLVTDNAWTTKDAIDYIKQFDEYKETVSRLFPALPRDYVDVWSISKVDALTLGYFLGCYPHKVVVLDIGTFVGVSAFHFANQPKVLRVISVDPNPLVVDEINDKSDMLGSSIDPEPLQGLRILDVARAALAEFGDAQQKIQLHVGTVGSNQVSIKEGSPDGLEKVEVPVLEPRHGVSLVAFVDGLHTKEGVQADLEAIFEKNPRSLVILDDCRGLWGPFVQAGVVGFVEKAQEKYHFQLFGDLGPSVATSNLGIVYPDVNAAEVKQTLLEFSELFSERLDPLRLLRREEELISVVIAYKNEVDSLRTVADRADNLAGSLRTENEHLTKRNTELEERNSRLEERSSRLEERNSRLQERSSQLIARYSRRRYKLVETLSERALQVPGVRKLVRRKPAQ